MLVRMVTHHRGMMETIPLPRLGETVDLPDHAAKALIEAKWAEPVPHDDKPAKSETKKKD